MMERVILFGRGNVFFEKIESFEKEYNIILVLDSSARESGEVTRGIPVKKPECVTDYPDVPVIIMSYTVSEMYKQLLTLGITPERIRFGVELLPFNTFEQMLFGDGSGKLIWKNDSLFYVNDKYNINICIDDLSLESVIPMIKNTPLYPRSDVWVKALPDRPLDDAYGMRRGTPVDRYYIEQFIGLNTDKIKGTVLEVGDREYTRKYGGEKVSCSEILHVAKEDAANGVIKGDLSTGSGLIGERYDCFICTQTLPFIYDASSAVRNIIKVLKPGGYALITVPGISQIIKYERRCFGHFWSFTDMSVRKLFEAIDDAEVCSVDMYGNIKSSVAFLYGLSAEEVGSDVLDLNDPDYQLIITAVTRRRT